MGEVKFDPFSADSNVDINWELTNPTCTGFIVVSGAAVTAAEMLSSYACLHPEHVAEIAAQAASGVPMSPLMIKRRAKEATKCSAFIASQNYVNATLCCGSLTAVLTTTGIAVAALALIWDQANNAFKNARVCGKDWFKWEQQDGVWVKTKGNHLLCLENLFLGKNHQNVSTY